MSPTRDVAASARASWRHGTTKRWRLRWDRWYREEVSESDLKEVMQPAAYKKQPNFNVFRRVWLLWDSAHQHQFFFVPEVSVHRKESELGDRFLNTKVVKGTRKYHRIVPKNTNQITAFELSDNVCGDTKTVEIIVRDRCSHAFIRVGKFMPPGGFYQYLPW